MAQIRKGVFYMLSNKNFLNYSLSSPVFGCDSVGHRLSDEVSFQLLDLAYCVQGLV